MAYNNGEAFEDELLRSLRSNKDLGVWVFKIPDTKTLRFFAGEQAVFQKNISDFMGIYQGIPFTLEAKSSRVASSFKVVDSIKEHQLTMPKEYEACGGISLFAINNRSKRNHYRCHIFKASVLDKIRAECVENGRKSIKWEQLYRYAECELPRLSMGWDIKPLLEVLSNEWFNRSCCGPDAPSRNVCYPENESGIPSSGADGS